MIGIPDDNHVVDMWDTKVRLGGDSVGKGSIKNNMGGKNRLMIIWLN